MGKRFENVEEYFKFLNIEAHDGSEYSFIKQLNKHYSFEESVKLAKSFFDLLEFRANNPNSQDSTDDEVYRIINKSYWTSMVFNGSMEYGRNIVIGNFFDLHIGEFGETMIDLGCMNGLLTCYIAAQNPDLHVVGVDKSWHAINVANELKEKLGLKNVEFINKNMYYIKGNYDTVIDLCALGGNNSLSNEHDRFSKLLHKLLANGGASISFERFSADEYVCGYFEENEIESGEVFKLDDTGSSSSTIYAMITNVRNLNDFEKSKED